MNSVSCNYYLLGDGHNLIVGAVLSYVGRSWWQVIVWHHWYTMNILHSWHSLSDDNPNLFFVHTKTFYIKGINFSANWAIIHLLCQYISKDAGDGKWLVSKYGGASVDEYIYTHKVMIFVDNDLIITTGVCINVCINVISNDMVNFIVERWQLYIKVFLCTCM